MKRDHLWKPLSKSEAGRLGALARYAKHGNPGTALGRKKGGVISQKIHAQSGGKFKTRLPIIRPRQNIQLAEFIGIMLGDGHLSQYQVSVTTNSKTDKQHALYTAELIWKIFGIRPKVTHRSTSQAVVVVASSVAMSLALENLGLRFGKKVENGVGVPTWIRRNKNYRAWCLRGLFDTDGSVYLDQHHIHGRLYRNIGMNFTNRNKKLLAFFQETMQLYGLRPTQTTQYALALRRKQDIAKYFAIIGTSNNKHRVRYERFESLRKSARVVESDGLENR